MIIKSKVLLVTWKLETESEDCHNLESCMTEGLEKPNNKNIFMMINSKRRVVGTCDWWIKITRMVFSQYSKVCKNIKNKQMMTIDCTSCKVGNTYGWPRNHLKKARFNNMMMMDRILEMWDVATLLAIACKPSIL